MVSRNTPTEYPQLPEPPVEKPVFQPSEEQLQRAKRLITYHWLTLYGPLIVLALLIAAFIVIGVWGTTAGFGNEVMLWRRTMSAMADIIIIFAAFTGALTCLIFPALATGAWVYGRHQGWKPWQTIRFFLWRIDYWVAKIQDIVQTRARQVAELMVQGRSWLAYFENLWLWVRVFLVGR